MKSKVLLWMPALLCILMFAVTGVFIPATTAASSHSAANSHPVSHDRVTHIHMQSVLFRVMKNVVMQVDSLDGVLVAVAQERGDLAR